MNSSSRPTGLPSRPCAVKPKIPRNLVGQPGLQKLVRKRRTPPRTRLSSNYSLETRELSLRREFTSAWRTDARKVTPTCPRTQRLLVSRNLSRPRSASEVSPGDSVARRRPLEEEDADRYIRRNGRR